MENGPFIDDFPIKTSIHKGFSMAMLNNQRVEVRTPTAASTALQTSSQCNEPIEPISARAETVATPNLGREVWLMVQGGAPKR